MPYIRTDKLSGQDRTPGPEDAIYIKSIIAYSWPGIRSGPDRWSA